MRLIARASLDCGFASAGLPPEESGVWGCGGERSVGLIHPPPAVVQVSWVLSHLLSDRKIAAASHNMVAYSFVDASSGVRVFDNDDDGEGGSGAKLASTIDNKGARDVIVVVSRWFGGVHLGPTRFQCINNAARDALVRAGVAKIGADGESGSEKSGKRRVGRES